MHGMAGFSCAGGIALYGVLICNHRVSGILDGGIAFPTVTGTADADSEHGYEHKKHKDGGNEYNYEVDPGPGIAGPRHAKILVIGDTCVGVVDL